jgi:hypothetical protein
MHGPGISTYFKGLKALLFALMCMSILAIPVIVLTAYGPYTSAADASLSLRSSTLGNAGVFTNVTRLFLPLTQCGAASFKADGSSSAVSTPCSITKSTAALCFSCFDVAGVIVLLAVAFWTQWYERAEEREILRVNVTIRDYTVLVKGIPASVLHNELGAHLAKVTGHIVSSVYIAEDDDALSELG